MQVFLHMFQVNPEITTFDDYFKKDYDEATYAKMEEPSSLLHLHSTGTIGMTGASLSARGPASCFADTKSYLPRKSADLMRVMRFSKT